MNYVFHLIALCISAGNAVDSKPALELVASAADSGKYG